jgi:ankyrin repeat protein
MSVCEVLAGIERYEGKRVAIQGVLEGYGKWQYLRGRCDDRFERGGVYFPDSVAIDFVGPTSFERDALLADRTRGYRFVDVQVTVVGTLVAKEQYEDSCTSYGVVGVGFGVQQHPGKVVYEVHFDPGIEPRMFWGVTWPDEYRPPCPVTPRQEVNCEKAGSLIEAVNDDCSEKVSLLMQRARERGLPDDVTPRAQTPLYSAVSRRNRAMVELLVNAGQNVNEAIVRKGNTPLCRAVSLRDLEIARYLLEHGAHPNPSREDECAPLVVASQWANPDMIELLVQFGARLDQRDFYKKSALDAAYASGRSENMKALVNLGADTNAVGAWGRPLLLQILSEPPAIGVLDAVLRSKARIGVTDSKGVTPLMMASREAWAGVAKKLIDAGADPNRQDDAGETPLMHAVRGGYVDAIPILLCAGANSAVRNHKGQTARDLVPAGNAPYLLKALKNGCIGID